MFFYHFFFVIWSLVCPLQWESPINRCGICLLMLFHLTTLILLSWEMFFFFSSFCTQLLLLINEWFPLRNKPQRTCFFCFINVPKHFVAIFFLCTFLFELLVFRNYEISILWAIIFNPPRDVNFSKKEIWTRN